jgi:hypothetical protein
MSAFAVIGPGETLLWGFDWDDEDWLGTETISTSNWTVGPAGPTLSSGTNDNTTTSIKASGFSFGKEYRLRNTVTTSGGQTGTRELVLRCGYQ